MAGDELQYLRGIGPKLAQVFVKFGLATLEDLVHHFPRRYEDRRNLPSIARLKAGTTATVRGKIRRIESRPTRGGKVILKATLEDGSGSMHLVWFNQPWVRRQLEEYKGEIIAYGLIKEGEWLLEMAAPEWEKLDEDADPEEFAKIVPVYPLTEGLYQRNVRRAVAAALQKYLPTVHEPLPEAIRKERRLQTLRWSLHQIHHPESEEKRLEARKRIVFDEFLAMQIAFAQRRAETGLEPGIAFPIEALRAGIAPGPPPKDSRTPDQTLFSADVQAGPPLWEQVLGMLPFTPTGAQERVIGEIWDEMARPHPMNRLVQGDVGSGKTAVAAAAMLAAVRSGYQAALMAPTEILAEQHAVNLRRLFDPLGIEVELLVGKLTSTQRKKAHERVARGLAHVAVGTHALIVEGVEFRGLGLAVIDEQHKFGVLQRAALRQKAIGNPDVLVMTATPIPRTITMSMYGDLDESIIDELPPGRTPIKTHWRDPGQRAQVYEGVRKLIDEGRQAYFVCPMVSESEKMLAQAAEEMHYRLSKEVYPDLSVDLLHGQMRPAEKEAAMERFRRGESQILVATTVIEVGVDVPNASVMVIEDANRFGLSQLHQLRGRVGRGPFQSFCILIAEVKSEVAQKRMEIMVESNDGFEIARADLEIRGPGDVAGTKQSGYFDFRLADLVQDFDVLQEARGVAQSLIAEDPRLERPEHRLLRDRAERRWSDVALITVS